MVVQRMRKTINLSIKMIKFSKVPHSESVITFTFSVTTAVVQSVRTFATHEEGWAFESKPRKTEVVKTGSTLNHRYTQMSRVTVGVAAKKPH